MCLFVCLFVCLFPCVTAGGFRISVFVACSLVNAVSQMLKKIGSKVSVQYDDSESESERTDL